MAGPSSPCFYDWMAGGGVKPGITYGQSDDYGLTYTQDGNDQTEQTQMDSGTMHIHDLNATILHLLGIDEIRLTYRYQGRTFVLRIYGRHHGHLPSFQMKKSGILFSFPPFLADCDLKRARHRLSDIHEASDSTKQWLGRTPLPPVFAHVHVKNNPIPKTRKQGNAESTRTHGLVRLAFSSKEMENLCFPHPPRRGLSADLRNPEARLSRLEGRQWRHAQSRRRFQPFHDRSTRGASLSPVDPFRGPVGHLRSDSGKEVCRGKRRTGLSSASIRMRLPLLFAKCSLITHGNDYALAVTP